MAGQSSSTTGSYRLRVAGDFANDDHGAFSCASGTLVSSAATPGQLSNGDADFFRITLVQSGILTVFTEGGTDTFGTLYDNIGTPLESNSSSGPAGFNFRISRQLPAGAYCVKVEGQSFNVAGSYLFRVEGPTVSFPPNVVGSSIGVNLEGVICYKPATEEVAFIIPPFPTDSWNCKAAGLPIQSGDTVWQIAIGKAK